MLKVGVVGTGHIVHHRHLPVYKKLKSIAVVTAICDIQESLAEDVARQFGIRHHYRTLSDMLKEDLDIVDICTPPQTHLSLGLEAMEAGCHMLIEKPIAMNMGEVDKMFEASRKYGVKLCVVHQNIFNPAVRKAKLLVENSSVGDLISVDVGALVRRDNYMCLNDKHWCHTLPGGIFFETLPHPVYLLQAFLRDIEPTCVLTRKFSNYPWMVADELRALVNAENGVGSIVDSCNSPFHGDTLNILGTKMGLQVDLWGRSVIKYGPRTQSPYSVGRNNIRLASQFVNLLGTTVGSSFTMFSRGVEISAHYAFIREFLNSIAHDHELPVSEQEARDNVRITEAICRQMRSPGITNSSQSQVSHKT